VPACLPVRLLPWALLDPGGEQVYYLGDARRPQVRPPGRRIDPPDYSTGEIQPPAMCGAVGPAVQEALPG
jgi:hypothetical protein